MESSGSNQHVRVVIGEEEYPYPSNLGAASFISVKLSGRDKYRVWKTQMLCLLKSHGMYGFIDGTIVSPQPSASGKEKVGDNHWLWTRSDALVKGWIMGSLSEQTVVLVLDRLTQKLHQGRNTDDFSAKDVWDEVQMVYGPAVLPPPPQLTFDRPPAQQTFDGPPPHQRFYGPPQHTFAGPPPQQTFHGPPPQQILHDPPPQLTIFDGPPPQQIHHDPPPQQNFFFERQTIQKGLREENEASTVPPQQILQQTIFDGPPPQQIFHGPLQQAVYGPPPPQTIYGPPQQQQIIYGPPAPQNIYGPPQGETLYGPPHLFAYNIPAQDTATIHQKLYHATLEENWYVLDDILRDGSVTILEKITNNGNTALHVAVGTTKNPESLQKFLERTPQNTQLVDVRNSDGSTLLHVAAIVGNTEAADILVQRNRNLLLAKDNESHTPLFIALSNMHKETGQCLLAHIDTDIETDTLFSGTSGDELLVTVISSKDFRLARDLLSRYKTLHSDALMMTIAQNFPCQPMIWADKTREKVSAPLTIAWLYASGRCSDICCFWPAKILGLFFLGIYCIILLFPTIYDSLVWPFIKQRVQTYGDAIELVCKACAVILDRHHPSSYHYYYMNSVLEATKQNAYEVVQHIVSSFPDAIWSSNEDGHNIVQYAVICRSEKVYNLIYQMSEHKNVYRTIKDTSGNNLLHLAARLAPASKLNLISGAALQIQRELQWFKEVEGFVCPLNIIQKNSFNETPQEVFTREHKDLVAEGEKWMKATAESFTITAALITTIVFAAAITVPGGSNQDTGKPIFSNVTAFTIFVISDAISLFGAVTSLLMFLSILTARFAEQDFLFKLPTKFIIGLATLFISTTAMIVAFGATLYLVFGQSNSRVLIPIAVLTCLPITSFVTLQLPLVIDLLKATYGSSIFGKKRDDHFY